MSLLFSEETALKQSKPVARSSGLAAAPGEGFPRPAPPQPAPPGDALRPPPLLGPGGRAALPRGPCRAGPAAPSCPGRGRARRMPAMSSGQSPGQAAEGAPAAAPAVSAVPRVLSALFYGTCSFLIVLVNKALLSAYR